LYLVSWILIRFDLLNMYNIYDMRKLVDLYEFKNLSNQILERIKIDCFVKYHTFKYQIDNFKQFYLLL